MISAKSFAAITAMFQSAPPTGVRGDLIGTGMWAFHHRYQVVSIRSPHRSEGRSSRRMNRGWFKRFQSAWMRGRSLPLHHSGFQSAPPTGVRGDARDFPVTRHGCPRTDVSIRSPHRSEGR